MLIEINENDIREIDGTWIYTYDGNVFAIYEVEIVSDTHPPLEGVERYN